MQTATATSDVKPATANKRVLISCDSHGGMPDGELRPRRPAEMRDLLPDLTQLMKSSSKFAQIMSSGAKKAPEILPEDRIKEQELDGVYAEVIYGGVPNADPNTL